MTSSLAVKKFGGSSLASIEKIKNVAKFIAQNNERDQKTVIIVSAMGATTNDLLAMAENICQEPQRRELDMLLSCGERTSMALLSIALNKLGVKSISLTGSQSGIITDANHRDASIIAIRPYRIIEALANFEAVIIAGFQGVSLTKEITTLRRGGSDTTAVAIAAALKADSCEIFSDVKGLLDADPKIIKNPKLIREICIDEIEKVSLYGAKVLAFEAAKLAKEQGITFYLKETGIKDEGTKVFSDNTVSLQSLHTPIITNLSCVLKIFLKELPKDLNVTCLLGKYAEEGFYVYINNDDINLLKKRVIIEENNIQKFGLIAVNNRAISFNDLMKVKCCLEQNKITYEEVFFYGGAILVIVKTEDVKVCVRKLYKEFNNTEY